MGTGQIYTKILLNRGNFLHEDTFPRGVYFARTHFCTRVKNKKKKKIIIKREEKKSYWPRNNVRGTSDIIKKKLIEIVDKSKNKKISKKSKKKKKCYQPRLRVKGNSDSKKNKMIVKN